MAIFIYIFFFSLAVVCCFFRFLAFTLFHSRAFLIYKCHFSCFQARHLVTFDQLTYQYFISIVKNRLNLIRAININRCRHFFSFLTLLLNLRTSNARVEFSIVWFSPSSFKCERFLPSSISSNNSPNRGWEKDLKKTKQNSWQMLRFSSKFQTSCYSSNISTNISRLLSLLSVCMYFNVHATLARSLGLVLNLTLIVWSIHTHTRTNLGS